MLSITNNTIGLTRGDTAYLTVNVTTAIGDEYIMDSDDTLTLSVKKTVDDTRYCFQVVSKGSNSLVISPENTKSLQFGSYVYDVQLNTATGDVYTVIPVNTFEILREVTC